MTSFKVVDGIIVGCLIALAVLTTPTCYASSPVLGEVTWYQDGEFAANGDKFITTGYTCAVRDRKEWKHWIRFEYQGRVVICYANDLMPEGSKAGYDLTPAAFMRLSPLRQGRLKNVKIEVVE